MKQKLSLLIVLILVVLVMGCQKDAAPIITSLTAEKDMIGPGEEVSITVQVEDENDDKLTYQWAKSGGSIAGEGSTVVWTAPTKEGDYTITVSVSDGKSTVKKSIKVTVIGPPVIDEILPQVVEIGHSITISADVTDLSGEELTYRWEDENGVLLADTPTLEWQAPDTYGVYSVTLKVANSANQASQTVLINVTDATHYAPTIEQIIFCFIDDMYVQDNLTANEQYLFLPFAQGGSSQITSFETTFDGQKLELGEEGFLLDVPDMAGEYELIVTLVDQIYTVKYRYTINVINNTRPTVDIKINNERIVNNYYVAEPGEELEIQVDVSDKEGDDLTSYVWGDIEGLLEEELDNTITAPTEEGMYDIGVLVTDGSIGTITRFTVEVDNGVDNSIKDQAIVDQINDLLNNFVTDFDRKDIDSILSYTLDSSRENVRDRLDGYFVFTIPSNSTIIGKSDIIQNPETLEYEVFIAINGKVSTSYSNYEYDRTDSIVISCVDNGEGSIVITDIYNFY